MSDEARPDGENGGDPVEILLDALVYAPLGFVLSAKRLWPELVATGRRQAESQLHTAHVVGRFVVQLAKTQGPGVLRSFVAPAHGRASDTARDAGNGTAETAAATAAEPAPAPSARTEDAPAGARPARPRPARPADVATGATAAAAGRNGPTHGGEAGLAIEGYDTLPASLIVPRLSGLGPVELERIRAHEAATRGRRTILSRIAQLEAERDAGS